MTSARTRDRLIQRLAEQGIRSSRVLERIRSVPRHLFVDEALASRAYEDTALPIGQGQTISQPYVVARMTESLLDGFDGKRVLEIGTGCGYQTAVLARLAKEVYSIERLAPLLAKARQHLREVRSANARLRHGDGLLGMPEVAPFDAIIMSAAATHVPESLLDQLAVGGRMVLPMASNREQRLCVIDRTMQGYSEKRMDQVKFVPLLPGIG
jgi:protein-L-isoaspartate(D-aspartate) O-methyltransferase